ncbi:transposase [Streptomyces sp. CA-106131]|uniref:transposase n=1 Tax=Streptomyces sp. CA-106131 TaxID=3240045 RepID=UPI003D9132D1
MIVSSRHELTVDQAKAVMHTLPSPTPGVDALHELAAFRSQLRSCLYRPGDALFELADAMLCTAGPVQSPVELSLEPEFLRRHSSVYDALHHGGVSADRLRQALVQRLSPARAGEPLMFAIDTTPLARPDARFADQRTMVMVRTKGPDMFLPGWDYSILVGIGWGATSWVQPLEARRVRPTEQAGEVALRQIRTLLADLQATRRWQLGDPPPLILLDAGYRGAELATELDCLPVQLLVRLRGNRRFHFDPPPRLPGTNGRPQRHGAEFSCARPDTRPAPDSEVSLDSDRYGKVTIRAWHNLHQQLTRRSSWWSDWPEDESLPIVRGTVLQVQVERLPHGGGTEKDLWLWHLGPQPADPVLMWMAYMRRFDQEHFHRFVKGHLGLGAARLDAAEAVDRWIALVLAAYAQLYLARDLVDDLRRPWQARPPVDATLSPYRVRLGFRRLRAKLPAITRAPKPRPAGPGRPKGSRNRPKLPRPTYRPPTSPHHPE